MVDRFAALSKSIFNKDISDVSSEEAQKFADQYPYFAPAQFLRLYKTSAGSDDYNRQYQKAILYYPDPLTFSSFLSPPQEFIPVTDEVPYEEIGIAEEIIEIERGDKVASLISNEEIFYAAENTEGIEVEEHRDVFVYSDEETESDTNVEEPIVSTEIPSYTAESEQATGEINISESEINYAEKDQPLSKAANENFTLTEAPATGFTFEPYHTVDYFASQGIKIPAEPAPQDQFGKQVKSFTDWLKTMKRLPVSERGKDVTAATEKGVENLAQHSVQHAEVVTESMAEVWVKQGNVEKAVEVYRKLSLQNPDKSSYFAAKIQELS